VGTEEYSRVLVEDRPYFGEGPFFDLVFFSLSLNISRTLSELCCEIASRRVPPVLGRDLDAGM
jgi:hypothetical protein